MRTSARERKTMEYNDAQLQWTEEQWNLVQQTVRDEARKVRVAASFLPFYGPLPPEAASVPLQELQAPAGNMRVDDGRTRRLTTISNIVELQRHQVAQPDLSSALSLFRRAANIIARVEDRLVFMGQPREDPDPAEIGVNPPTFRVTGGEQFRGLIAHAARQGNSLVVAPGSDSGTLVTAVAAAIANLEGNGHLHPFALVLGARLFIAAHTPEANSLVLPADRIKPLLEGPMLRSSTIHPDEGLVVALAGDPVDLVVASDIGVQFLLITPEPRYTFRVAERFSLRIKQRDAIVAILPNA
jgi:uncharacterized linocin/CFP29 family protein